MLLCQCIDLNLYLVLFGLCTFLDSWWKYDDVQWPEISGYDLLFDVMHLGTRSQQGQQTGLLLIYTSLFTYSTFAGSLKVQFEIFSPYMNMFYLSIAYHVIFCVHIIFMSWKFPNIWFHLPKKHTLFPLSLTNLFLK